MESDKNPFPKIDLFPRLRKIAKGVGACLTHNYLAPTITQSKQFAPIETTDDGYRPLEIPEVPTQEEIVTVFGQDWVAHEGYGSEGNYIGPEEN